jgi:drug/metabolite transporter (DMT)-like permease
MNSSDRSRIFLALGSLYVIWGSTFLGIRIALEGGFPPMLLAGLRFVAAGGTLYAVLRARGVAPPTRVEWRSSLFVGTLLVCANGCVAVAEQWVSSGVAAVAIASVPLWVALFAGLFGRWPSRGEWLGLAVGLAGVALLQSGGELRTSPAGTVVLTVACASWALGSIWSRRLPLPNGLMASAAQMLAGGAVLLAFALLYGERLAAIPSSRALVAFAYLVVAGSIVGYSAYAFLLGRVRPTLAASYAYVNPVIAVFLGAALAGEAVAPHALGALGLILGGVAMLALRRATA